MTRLIATTLTLFISAGYAFADDGKDLFVSSGCNKCHSVSTQGIEATAKSEKMRGPDLAKAGGKHEAAWIVGLVTKQELLDGKKHKGKFKGSDADLQVIATWVASLKEE